MKITLTLFILLIQFGFRGYSQEPLNELYTEDSITLNSETGIIRGSIINPSNNNKKILVLLIAGSGPTDRNGNNPMMKNNSLKMLTNALGENGIASVRYDKRGIAGSMKAAPSENELRFETYINDAIDWIRMLQDKKEYNKIIIAGHSEGSLIGMIAAQNSKVDGFISIAGAGLPANEILAKQMEAQPAFVKDYALPRIDSLKQGYLLNTIDPMFNALFRSSVQPYMISWFAYDPRVEIKKLNMPVLIIQGTSDIQVGVEDAENLAEAAPKAELEIINEMNHILKTSVIDRQVNIATYSNPDLPLHKDLIAKMVDFIYKIK